MKIFLNPGHAPNGIPDPGVVNLESGRNESDVCKAISNRVANYLSVAGYQIQLLQSDSLLEIVHAANNSGADLFVSIHCNASANHLARGTESWYFIGSDRGKRLAELINSQIVSSIPNITDRGVKAGSFYVLRNTDMPAVLVETAFLDNPHDEDFLLKYDLEFPRAISRGISDYFK